MNIIQKILYTNQTLRSPTLLLLDKLKLINGDILYSTRNGLHFIARSETSDIDEIIVVTSGYAYPLDLLHTIRRPIIIDLGSHIGTFSVFAHHYYEQSQIFAYEPSKENFHYLKINLYLNNAPVHIVNAGVSTYSGKGYIQTDRKNPDEFTVNKTKVNFQDEKCQLITLARIIRSIKKDRIDILKMDIEGSEHELLKNNKVKNILRDKVKYLFIECHDQSRERSTTTIFGCLSPLFTILERRDHVYILKNKLL